VIIDFKAQNRRKREAVELEYFQELKSYYNSNFLDKVDFLPYDSKKSIFHCDRLVVKKLLARFIFQES